ncbi:MAG: ParA family protein, partial [Pseudomonadota bacterium]
MKSIAPVAAVANFKGGVGKSTTALMLADGLAWYYGLNVIVYDFDAQANLSQLLLTGEGVQRALNCEHGITPILETFAPNDPRPISDTHRALDTVRACAIEELVKNRDKTGSSEGWISLLPAHPHMRFLEPWLERSPGPGWYDVGDAIVGRVNEATLAEREAADIVIIDCPPHVSALCRAALKMADVYVTPTLPEALSIWGVTQFAKWMTHAEMQEWLHLTRDEFAARQFVVATRLVRASATQRRALEII